MKFNLGKSSLAFLFLVLLLSNTVSASTLPLRQKAPESEKATEKTAPSESASPSTNSDEPTAAEFREYVAGKLSDMNLNVTDKQLDSIVAKVDANNDGKITESEFGNRIAAIQSILSSENNDSNKEPKSDSDSSGSDSSDSEDLDSDESEPAKIEPVIIDALTPSTDATVLLITADELAKSWVPFAKWKTQNGKLTKIVTVGQIAEEFEADSIQEKIRLCVRKHIDSHETRWVILGGDCLPGDKGRVPGGHNTVHRQESDGIPTDIVYLSPTNWDADEDGIFGEFKDDKEAISYPDGSVGLGRIPVRTTADVAAFTDKVISYESEYPTSEFATKMIYTCTEKYAYPKVRNSWDSYLSKAWDGEMGRFFSDETPWDEEDDPGSHQLSAENLVSLFNQNSTGKMHIHGHGLLPVWVLEKSKFSKKHVGQLENKGAYPLITTVSCFTGQYDSKDDPSIVEQLIRAPEAGSVAIVAPVRTGKAHFAKRSDFRLMITEGKLDGTTMTMTNYWSLGLGEGISTGHAMMKAKQAMAEDAADADAYHLCICELNLLGDPTLDMRAEAPRNPELQPSVRKLKLGSEIKVKTDAPGATICLWNQKDIYEVSTADKDGNAKFLVNGDLKGCKVSASGQNLNSVSKPLIP